MKSCFRSILVTSPQCKWKVKPSALHCGIRCSSMYGWCRSCRNAYRSLAYCPHYAYYEIVRERMTQYKVEPEIVVSLISPERKRCIMTRSEGRKTENRFFFSLLCECQNKELPDTHHKQTLSKNNTERTSQEPVAEADLLS